MIETIKNLFSKKEEPKSTRSEIQLLRENLNLIELDIFYLDDPIPLKESDRKQYLKVFNDFMSNKLAVDRIKYLINKQAVLALQSEDKLGAMNINGMATVLEDLQRLSDMYDKEVAQVDTFNKYNVF